MKPQNQPADLAERLYECARAAGTIRHDAVMWWLLAPRTRARWQAFAEKFAPAVGQPFTLADSRAEANALYQAALDQPQPSVQLREAIRQYEASVDQVARTRVRRTA